MRKGVAERKTLETHVRVELRLDGSGIHNVKTPIPFLNHMLKTLCIHSLMDLTVEAKGDLVHHIVEDTALVLGRALGMALGDRTGIKRFGYIRVPMDDSLAEAAVDLIGRPYAVVDLKLTCESIEGLNSKLMVHFIRSLAYSIPATIHVNVIYGFDEHHKVEAAFKALAVALREAWTIIDFPTTTKGVYI